MIIRSDLVQGSEEWLLYRRKKIMASDSPIILGHSPFCTSKKLFHQKKDDYYKSFETEPMRRGKLLEDDGRKFAESQLKMFFPPCVIEHDLFPIYAASLDGINEENKCLLEIKVPGDKIFTEAILGKIPPYWLCQIQHQLFVSDYALCYLCIYDGFDGKIIQIERDQEYIDKLKIAADEWWDYFQRDEIPPCDDEYIKIELTDFQLLDVEKWIAAREALKSAEQDEKNWRSIVTNFGDDGNCDLIFDGKPKLRMTRVQREGSVDWKGVCVAKGITEIDIAQFRKQEIGYYKLSEIK